MGERDSRDTTIRVKAAQRDRLREIKPYDSMSFADLIGELADNYEENNMTPQLTAGEQALADEITERVIEDIRSGIDVDALDDRAREALEDKLGFSLDPDDEESGDGGTTAARTDGGDGRTELVAEIAAGGVDPSYFPGDADDLAAAIEDHPDVESGGTRAAEILAARERANDPASYGAGTADADPARTRTPAEIEAGARTEAHREQAESADASDYVTGQASIENDPVGEATAGEEDVDESDPSEYATGEGR